MVWQSGNWNDVSIPNARNPAAIGINEKGDVLYVDERGVGNQRSYVFKNGLEIDVCRSVASAINNKGEVVYGVQYSEYKNGRNIGAEYAIWNDGSRTPISLSGNPSLYPLDINDNEEVVGYASFPDDTTANWRDHPAEPPTISKAFYWKDGRGYYLQHCLVNPKGWILMDARAINNRGEIVGSGVLKGKVASFILYPLKNHLHTRQA